MEHGRDEEAEWVLGDIIAAGANAMSYLNETDGLEEEGEEAGYGPRTTEETVTGDRMPVQEGGRDNGSGDRTEAGQVYILIKPVLTIAN